MMMMIDDDDDRSDDDDDVTVVMIMAVTMGMVLSIMTAAADCENDPSLVMITVMNLAKNCKADCDCD